MAARGSEVFQLAEVKNITTLRLARKKPARLSANDPRWLEATAEFLWIVEFLKLPQNETWQKITSNPASWKFARKTVRDLFGSVEALEENNKKCYGIYQSWPPALRRIVDARPIYQSFDGYLELARILKASPRLAAKNGAVPTPLNARENRLWSVIQRGSEGPTYCRELHEAHLSPSKKWIAKGCPGTYPQAYLDPYWRQRIQDEKSKVSRRAKLISQPHYLLS